MPSITKPKKAKRAGKGPRGHPRLVANALFEMGEIIVSPRAKLDLDYLGLSLDGFLSRHGRGDWGDVERIRRESKSALETGVSLRSEYLLVPGVWLRIVTFSDRALTCVYVIL